MDGFGQKVESQNNINLTIKTMTTTRIDIDGEIYERIEKGESNKKINPIIAPFLMMAINSVSPVKEYSLDFIISEYRLIKQKKSNLSRRERNYIEYLFNKNFKKVNQ